MAGTLTATTCNGSSGDTKLAVYSAASAAGPFTCIDSNDDDSSCGLLSTVTVALKPGSWFFFALSKYRPTTADPTAVLTLNHTPPPKGAWAAPETVPSLPYTASGVNVSAARACLCGSQRGRCLWPSCAAAGRPLPR